MKKIEIIKLKIKLDILTWCLEDYTDLRTITDFVNSYFLLKNMNLIKINTLKTIKNLLEEKLVLAGALLKDDTFKVWNKKNIEIILEIKKKWNNLTRELQPHEIVWFDITEKGEKEFEYLNSLPELEETDPFYFDDNEIIK